MKQLGALVEAFTPYVMTEYAEVCAWALARAHARSGTPAAISGYLGKSDAFDKAVTAFAVTYADQSERDHAVLKKAVRSGHLPVSVRDAVHATGSDYDHANLGALECRLTP